MGSDWTWELRTPVAAEAALRDVFALAAERDLHPHRPDGLINLFTNADSDLLTVTEPEAAIAALATGEMNGQFWTGGDVDIFVEWRDGTLVWALDAVFCRRRPSPEADPFRELHARLTSLWLVAAERLDADLGRIRDEWSSEQAWQAEVREDIVAPTPLSPVEIDSPSGWPGELGWWTYLGRGRNLSTPPLPEVAARTRRLPSGALLITLLDDPAAVDPLHYAYVMSRWFRSLAPGQ
ncbi:hypothetical protein M1L60_31620 [Actinoplanes sp. TRM 88003]|uniref:Uncharacterized protein n=1 Tax=Paractinoplanes aksuensis TaxID=2939490 RepID=A0ABT1DWA2_9ACTN|nr:hypothetical protein [Actinoplanes aksuensis]MCO8275139.1 hypothetical protein [Actinoplanes aksuensis]